MPVTEVTEWCAPIMMTPKKGMDHIRMHMDLSRPNHYVSKERYQLLIPLEAVAHIAAGEANISQYWML